MAKGKKTGGRVPGSKSLTPAEITFVNAVERALKAGQITDTLVNLTCRHLTNEKHAPTAWDALKRMLDMKFGKPVQPVAGKEGAEPIRVLVEHV